MDFEFRVDAISHFAELRHLDTAEDPAKLVRKQRESLCSENFSLYRDEVSSRRHCSLLSCFRVIYPDFRKPHPFRNCGSHLVRPERGRHSPGNVKTCGKTVPDGVLCRLLPRHRLYSASVQPQFGKRIVQRGEREPVGDRTRSQKTSTGSSSFLKVRSARNEHSPGSDFRALNARRFILTESTASS